MTPRRSEFDQFMKEVEAASDAAGESEVTAAYGEHFRLARQVIQLRKKAGWTQQQFAKVTGVQQSEISRIERGQGNPTLRTLQALAHSGRMTIGFVSARTVRRRTPKAGRIREDCSR